MGRGVIINFRTTAEDSSVVVRDLIENTVSVPNNQTRRCHYTDWTLPSASTPDFDSNTKTSVCACVCAGVPQAWVAEEQNEEVRLGRRWVGRERRAEKRVPMYVTYSTLPSSSFCCAGLWGATLRTEPERRYSKCKLLIGIKSFFPESEGPVGRSWFIEAREDQRRVGLAAKVTSMLESAGHKTKSGRITSHSLSAKRAFHLRSLVIPMTFLALSFRWIYIYRVACNCGGGGGRRRQGRRIKSKLLSSLLWNQHSSLIIITSPVKWGIALSVIFISLLMDGSIGLAICWFGSSWQFYICSLERSSSHYKFFLTYGWFRWIGDMLVWFELTVLHLLAGKIVFAVQAFFSWLSYHCKSCKLKPYL